MDRRSASDGAGNDHAFLLIPEREPNLIRNGGFNIAFETPFRIQAEHRGWNITHPFAVGDWDLSGNRTDFAARFMPHSVELFGTRTNVNNPRLTSAEQYVDFSDVATTLRFDVRFDTVFQANGDEKEFRLELNGQVVWSIDSPASPETGFTTYAVPIPAEFLGLTDVNLRSWP